MKKTAICIAALLLSAGLYAQKDNRNMMLNAESATVPCLLLFLFFLLLRR